MCPDAQEWPRVTGAHPAHSDCGGRQEPGPATPRHAATPAPDATPPVHRAARAEHPVDTLNARTFTVGVPFCSSGVSQFRASFRWSGCGARTGQAESGRPRHRVRPHIAPTPLIQPGSHRPHRLGRIRSTGQRHPVREHRRISRGPSAQHERPTRQADRRPGTAPPPARPGRIGSAQWQPRTMEPTDHEAAVARPPHPNRLGGTSTPARQPSSQTR
jgi:hypothetical protein